ncbi:MAG TPA: DUF929 family protein [Trebonia sp.]|nr:DUF929 family protein [Trebonia sp.]
MGKASRTKNDSSRRERIAAQRAAERRREQRQRLLVVGGSILAVVIIVVGFVVYKATSGSTPGNTSNGPTGATLTSVTNEVTGVSSSILDQVGAGGSSLQGGIKAISGSSGSGGGASLTSNGKPEVFFYGAEYCPYCAANRWGLVVALSRFGTFSGLKTISSSATDSPASVPTFTFYGSSYTSKYISFVPVETLGNVAGSNGQYPTLQTPTSAETAIVNKYDGSQGSIPFVDFGGKYDQSGDLAMLQPTSLTGSWETIAADLNKPSTANAKAVDGAANFMTAAICKLTNNQPATACTSTVQGLESQL